MNALDFSPLFRSTVGFDRVGRLLDQAFEKNSGAGYPPYNIVKTGPDAYRVTMAVAGFGADDLTITTKENSLVVSGKPKAEAHEGQALYRGIAARSFERRFALADYIKVAGAELANGLLNIELVREVPEAMRPRTIKIASGGDERKAA